MSNNRHQDNDNQSTIPSDQTTHFGFQEVKVAEKQGKVKQVFDSVAPNYDLMNDLMSMGLHRVWKKEALLLSQVRKGDRVLDLASGTADLGLALYDQVGDTGTVVLSDINAAMLQTGQERMDDKGYLRAQYALANAESLPFESESFDCITMAFGLRNVTDKSKALKEAHRVLKVGGRMIVLEFSKPPSHLFSKVYDFYSFQFLPKLGQKFAKDADSYQYLAESIRRHPDQETLAGMMQEAGFEKVNYYNLTFGIVAIHRGYRVE